MKHCQQNKILSKTKQEKAIKKLERLPKKRQDGYASIIFDELDSEVRWDKLFADTSARQQKNMKRAALGDSKKGAKLIKKVPRA